MRCAWRAVGSHDVIRRPMTSRGNIRGDRVTRHPASPRAVRGIIPMSLGNVDGFVLCTKCGTDAAAARVPAPEAAAAAAAAVARGAWEGENCTPPFPPTDRTKVQECSAWTDAPARHPPPA